MLKAQTRDDAMALLSPWLPPLALIPEYRHGDTSVQPSRLLKFHAPEIVLGIDSIVEPAPAAVRLGALRPLLVTDPGVIARDGSMRWWAT